MQYGFPYCIFDYLRLLPGLPETLGIKTDVHEMLALQETVAQYRRRALYLYHLENACVELQDLSERPVDFVPEIALVLPET